MSERRDLAVVSGYSGLVAAIRARKDEMQISDTELEAIAGLTRGHVSKLLAPGASKVLGPLSMGRLLRALGVELIVAENQDATAKVREQYTPRDENQVRHRSHVAVAISPAPHWILTREKAIELRRLQIQLLTKEERARIAKKAWRTRRKRERERRLVNL